MNRITYVAVFAVLCTIAGVLRGDDLLGNTDKDFFSQSWPALSAPYRHVTLSSEVDETVETVAVEEGQSVKKGDILIRFDSRLIRARIDIAAAEADFDTRIEGAQTRYEYLLNEFQRLEGLGEYKLDVEFDKARYDMNMARLDLDELGRTKRLAEWRLDYYRTEAQNYVIKSPIDGVVSHVWIEPAEMAQKGQQLVEVIAPDIIEVRVLDLPEEHAAKVAYGQQALVKFTTLPEREFAGTVSCVSPYVDSRSGTFTLKILVEPSTETVKPGMGCEVRFVRPQRL